jgi:hypothetical protein
VQIGTIASVANEIVTSTAIIVGGVWTYFKFIKGRTFAHRAELDISASFVSNNANLYLSISVVFKNTGSSQLPLNPDMKVIRLFRMSDNSHGGIHAADWERISTVSILDQHDWLEAQETVSDTLIYCLSSSDKTGHGVFQIEALVAAPRRLITRKGTQWQSRIVVFLPPNSSAAHKARPVLGLRKRKGQKS